MHCCLLSVLLCLPACLQGWVHLLHLLLARIALALLLLLAAGLLLSLLASRRRHLLLALVPMCRTEAEEQMVEQMVRLGSTASAGITTKARALECRPCQYKISAG